MRILFINKYDTTGGAAIAARRIAGALGRFHGTENHFLVGIKRSDLPDTIPTRGSGWPNHLERGVNLLTSLVGRPYYYFPFSTSRIRAELQRINPDVISLHNIHGGFFDTGLLPEITRAAPAVWTMHDMWAFTASAAHTFGETAWKIMEAGKTEHHHFPKVGVPRGSALLRRKKNIYADSRLNFVAPSRWLLDLAKQSPVLEGKQIDHIPNGLDLELFSPGDKLAARKQLGIDPDQTVLCFSAEKLMSSEYKGGQELLDILKLLDERKIPGLHLLMIGKEKLPLNLSHISNSQTGYLHSEADMVRCYRASDIFIYPTRADTLPSSLMEASACGLPAVSFDVGGCGEIIANGENGYLVPAGDVDKFLVRTLKLINHPQLRQEFSEKARALMVARFAIDRTAAAYFDLFTRIKNS